MYRGKFAFQNRLRLACSGKEIYHFSEGRFNGGFFALRFWGGLDLERLIHGGAYFRNFTVYM